MDSTNQIEPTDQKTKKGQYWSRRTSEFSILRSITRLVIGGIFTGADGFSSQIRDWESQASSKLETPVIQKSISTDLSEPRATSPESIHESLDAEAIEFQEDTSRDLARYAFIGLVFDTQERFERGLKTTVRLAQAITDRIVPFVVPVQDSRVLSPARKRFNQLVDRGETELQKWVEIGRDEYPHSKQLADIALYETVDFWIDYFAENPEVIDLVATQSMGFSEEVIEEVRERTVSADNLLEGIVRVIFRQPARATLPPPPQEIQMEALSIRRQKTNGNP